MSGGSAIRAKLVELEGAIAQAEHAAKSETPQQAGLDKDWTINEDGEVRTPPLMCDMRRRKPSVLTMLTRQVVNEEGLPMFDIHEQLPALPESRKIQEIKQPPVEDGAKSKTRYLIKKGGKQTFGKLLPPPLASGRLAASDPPPTPRPRSADRALSHLVHRIGQARPGAAQQGLQDECGRPGAPG